MTEGQSSRKGGRWTAHLRIPGGYAEADTERLLLDLAAKSKRNGCPRTCRSTSWNGTSSEAACGQPGSGRLTDEEWQEFIDHSPSKGSFNKTTIQISPETIFRASCCAGCLMSTSEAGPLSSGPHQHQTNTGTNN